MEVGRGSERANAGGRVLQYYGGRTENVFVFVFAFDVEVETPLKARALRDVKR